MIGWQISRYIIDIPWLHNLIGTLFLSLLVMYILGNVYVVYLLIRGSLGKENTVVWTYKGKTWNYWKRTK